MGLTVMDVQYVAASEMIFNAVKPKLDQSAAKPQPGLRIATR
jgi:hypothetical protein